jgi:hypothetical protein
MTTGMTFTYTLCISSALFIQRFSALCATAISTFQFKCHFRVCSHNSVTRVGVFLPCRFSGLAFRLRHVFHTSIFPKARFLSF